MAIVVFLHCNYISSTYRPAPPHWPLVAKETEMTKLFLLLTGVSKISCQVERSSLFRQHMEYVSSIDQPRHVWYMKSIFCLNRDLSAAVPGWDDVDVIYIFCVMPNKLLVWCLRYYEGARSVILRIIFFFVIVVFCFSLCSSHSIPSQTISFFQSKIHCHISIFPCRPASQRDWFYFIKFLCY